MLKQASDLIKNKQFKQAEILLEHGLVNLSIEDQEIALQFLAKIAFAEQHIEKSIRYLQQLINRTPDNFAYVNALTELFLKQNDLANVCQCHANFVKLNPKNEIALFNAGYYHKQFGLFKLALVFYQQALDCGINQPEEVYLNMAVIESDHLFDDEQAIFYLEQALKINPNYISALMNLANLYEQLGNKESCISTFLKVLKVKPDHYEALARIIDATKYTDSLAPELLQAEKLLKEEQLDASVRCDLSYALGKAYDDCQQYDKAITYYHQANQTNKQLVPKFDRMKHRQYIDSIIEVFSLNNTVRVPTENEIKPVFICGMFRSGSTLLEQILASHSEVITSGELDFFPRYIAQNLKNYPADVTFINHDNLNELAEKYQELIKNINLKNSYITDKRPDNFLLIGLIKQVFPQAKIIWTQRNELDNCLSVYFLRLGAAMNYATDLEDIQFYYKEQLRLKQFWQNKFHEDMTTVDYDQLIKTPEQEITKVLHFLGLEWRAQCLRFFEQKNSVKTASVWQVRKPLYSSSSGRHQHYLPYLNQLIEG